jgi:hypothetical protein
MTGPGSATPMIAHMVYFTLKDASPAAQEKQVSECRRWLKEIPGIVFFAVGTMVPDLVRPINVRDYHVGLHIVFSDRKAHDDYQVDTRHRQFIEANKENWQQVRIFDCNAS